MDKNESSKKCPFNSDGKMMFGAKIISQCSDRNCRFNQGTVCILIQTFFDVQIIKSMLEKITR